MLTLLKATTIYTQKKGRIALSIVTTVAPCKPPHRFVVSRFRGIMKELYGAPVCGFNAMRAGLPWGHCSDTRLGFLKPACLRRAWVLDE